MQITETNADGLKREFKIVVPAGQIEDRVESKLKELAQTVQMPGFRPGKVPMPMLRKKYRSSLMGEVLEAQVNDATNKAIEDGKLRPAMQPKIEITSFADGKDLEFTVALETLPEVEPVDFATIELERPKVEVSDEEIDNALARIAERNEASEAMPAEHKAETGDIAVIDFTGKRNGEAFAGGAAQNYQLKLGSGSFIPGFEEQLVGVAAGDEKTIPLTFPEQYHNAELAGQPVEFDIKVHEVRRPSTPAIDDELAKKLGLDDLAALRGAVREQIEREYGALTRTIVKRRLLDALADRHDFTVPQGMVDVEFEHIWKQVEEDQKNGRLDPEDQGKDEETLKGEYRLIAERRVRLGLLLSEVGRRNEITVTQQDVNRAVVEEARRYPGQEGLVFQYYQKNPDALNMLKAPIYEDKVVDFVLELAKTTETTVTPEELSKLAEGAEKGQA
jgi:trigger factor